MDNNSWFCQVGGQQYGPYALQHLQQYVAEGRLNPASLVRHASSPQWVPAGSVPGLFSQQPVAQPAFAQQPTQGVAVGVAVSAPTAVAEEPPAEDEVDDRRSPLLFYTIVALCLIIVGGACGLFAVIYNRHSPDNVQITVQPDKTYSSTKAQTGSDRNQMALNGVEHWTDALTVTKLQAKSFRLQFAGIWAPPPDKGSGASDRFLYVEIRVQNVSQTGKLHFTTWNKPFTPKRMPTAVMIDDRGQLCHLVSTSSEDGQQESTVMQLEPGEEVSDVLVFEYPESGFEHVNMALSYEAIDQGTRYFGFKIPRSMIGKEQVEPASSEPQRSGKSGSKIPTLQDINRQLERFKREEEMEKKRQGE